MSTKDKQKVIGEELDQTKIERFLEMQPYTDENRDFHALVKAYRGLPSGAFEQFLEFFKSQGRDINAADKNGNSLLAHVKQHSRQQGYIEALQKHGAQ